MWFGQTGLNVNRFETGLSASVNGAYAYVFSDMWVPGLPLVFKERGLFGEVLQTSHPLFCSDQVSDKHPEHVGVSLLMCLPFILGVHNFKVVNMKKPTWCSHCGKLIYGLVAQGRQCSECGVPIHHKCHPFASEHCTAIGK